MTLSSLRTPGLIGSILLGVFFALHGWGVISLVCWAGSAAIIKHDRYDQTSNDIFSFIFLLILAGLGFVIVKSLFDGILNLLGL